MCSKHYLNGAIEHTKECIKNNTSFRGNLEDYEKQLAELLEEEKELDNYIATKTINTEIKTFKRSWKNSKDNPPKEGGRYWCLIEEQNDLGRSMFQWNCSYHTGSKRWVDGFENYNVVYWTELAPMSF